VLLLRPLVFLALFVLKFDQVLSRILQPGVSVVDCFLLSKASKHYLCKIISNRNQVLQLCHMNGSLDDALLHELKRLQDVTSCAHCGANDPDPVCDKMKRVEIHQLGRRRYAHTDQGPKLRY
jgi:hypothetical protein